MAASERRKGRGRRDGGRTGARVYIFYFHPRVVVVGAVVRSCRRGRKVTRAKGRESSAAEKTRV